MSCLGSCFVEIESKAIFGYAKHDHLTPRRRNSPWARIITAPRINPPPSRVLGLTTSPNRSAANTTVTTGSMVESMAALDAPIRCRPAKKVTPGRTVATITIAPTAPHPATEAVKCGPSISINPVDTTPADAKITVSD